MDNAANEANGFPIFFAVFLLQSAGLGLQLRVYRGVPLVSLNAITPDKKVEVRPQVICSFRVALCQGMAPIESELFLCSHSRIPSTRYVTVYSVAGLT